MADIEYEKCWQIGKILTEGGTLEEMEKKFDNIKKGIFLWSWETEGLE